ncbi:sugar transferase, partial [Leptospira santarosai]|uniref:sugar transferase n=1 Tax=Leptospira santarosai TaxID=28183 RepID=UPI0040372ABE
MISLSRWSKFFDMKRMIEASLAAVALVLFSPVLVGVSLLILIIDGRPIFFLQERIGLNRKPFRIVKFRTMKDGVVTHLGSWFRKTGIDELPQIWNVLIGDMSVVGPRPLTQLDVDRLGWDRKFYEIRWSVLPGITGLSQLYSGMGSRVSFCFERSYLNSKNLGLDIGIVFLTFAMNGFGKKRIRDGLKSKLKNRKRMIPWKKWAQHFRKNESRPLPKIDAEVLKLRPNEMQS